MWLSPYPGTTWHKTTVKGAMPCLKCSGNEQLGCLHRQKTLVYILAPSHRHHLNHSAHMAGKQLGHQVEEYFKQNSFSLWGSHCHFAADQERTAISTAAVSTQLLRTPAREGAYACMYTTKRSSLLLKCAFKSLSMKERTVLDLLYDTHNRQ